MNLSRIITVAQRMNTLCIRAAYSNEIEDRRRHLVQEFNCLAEDLGKITSANGRPDWTETTGQVALLLVEAIRADEASFDGFQPIGHVAVVDTRLALVANALGLRLEDAATAPVEPEDEDAMAAVEGGRIVREAAE